MIQSEAQLEQQFLEKLQEMKYTYRSDIRDLDALESNFRQKFERLNFVNLSDDEFRKLLQENVTPTYSLPPSACARSRPSHVTTVPPSTTAL